MPAISRRAEPRFEVEAAFASPSSQLVARVGLLATDVARLWPRPHAPFFALDPARQWAVALVAARLSQDLVSKAQADLADWSIKRMFAQYWPEAPNGLIEVLRKLGPSIEVWDSAKVCNLVSLLSQKPRAAKVLFHLPELDPHTFGTLQKLPDELCRVRLVRLIAVPGLAGLVTQAAKRATASGQITLSALGDRLERASSTEHLFRMLIEAVGLERLAPPPIPGNDWFVPIATVSQINRAALKFNNCLRTRIPALLAGEGAYYEVLGDEPVIVELVRSSAGLWRVGEIRGHANAEVSVETLRRIRFYVEPHTITAKGGPDRLAIDLAHVAFDRNA